MKDPCLKLSNEKTVLQIFNQKKRGESSGKFPGKDSVICKRLP